MSVKKTAAKSRRGLGKGLKLLMGDIEEENLKTDTEEKQAEEETVSGNTEAHKSAAVETGERLVKLSEIYANENQPRKSFDASDLAELTSSVRQYGILQPLLVQKEGTGYRIIAGERRYRAAKAAGLKEIPVIIRNYSSQQAAEISIIENVQRADLNPLEEAMAYQMLMKDYGLKQEEIAERVSKNRTTITNALRLLKLCQEVQEMVAEGALSAGHARTLVSLEDAKLQRDIAAIVVEKSLSVRETERLVKQAGRSKKTEGTKENRQASYDIFYQEYEDRMRSILGTKVHISRRDKNKGRIEIDYYSAAELERIMDLLRSIRH
ncbi:ParB family chromosome partitioning protein [Fusobacterium naviforme]|nr:ParB/RepB/Spo0J family partition protein [Fusobacterium naviforme]PSL10994.1 ParB family chromosome partitioning protein [Fusobacterium naviforme]STO28367.1 Probable chromosome-partitioning protein parB [Fusobacterium naviforme]